MNNYKYHIAIDLLGSDKGPEAIILGAYNALVKYPDLFLTLAGPKDLVDAKFKELGGDLSRVNIIDANDTITNYENPTQAIFAKPHASIAECMKHIKANDEYVGMITAGSSGGILVGSFRYLANETKTRPCMAATLPHAQGGFTCLVDTGATIDCTSEELHEFARLGSDFMKKLYNIPSPRVGLLSNGAEPTKGNHLVKETYPILENDKDLNFVGNIEGNCSLNGDCDVLVCDGFAGNQVLKNSEGMAKRLITDIVKYSKMNNRPEFMEIVQYLMSTYDFGSLGGGVVLGARKPIIKCRGNSDDKAIVSAVGMLVNFANGEAFLRK